MIRSNRLVTLLFVFCAVTVIALPQLTTAQDIVLPETLPGGFTLVRPVEYYNQGDLFELINGQAVFYLSYGFEKLHHAYYEKDGETYKTDLYQVADELSALGCYREQMDEGADPLGAGTEGYLLEYLSACFKGIHYLEIVPEADGRPEDMKAIATQVMALVPGTDELPAELALFPGEGLVTGTESYYGESLLSYSFLGQGLSAEYTQPGDRNLRVFISMTGSTENARTVTEEFMGKLTDPAAVSMQGAESGVRGELPYRGASYAFNTGNYVFGCIGAADADAAMAVLEKVLANLTAAGKN